VSASKELIRGFTLVQISAMPTLEMFAWFAELSAAERARLDQLRQDFARKNSMLCPVELQQAKPLKLKRAARRDSAAWKKNLLHARSLVAQLLVDDSNDWAYPYRRIEIELLDCLLALQTHAKLSWQEQLSCETAEIIAEELNRTAHGLLEIKQELSRCAFDGSLH
jgi:hypothetical protein